MRRLVIDTATPACSVALFDDGKLVAGEYQELGRGHAERLIPLIQNLPENGRADAIHVNVGPGSFTGVRVGISAARALALAWGIECYGYGCLQLAAAMAVEGQSPSPPVDAAMHGGHGEYFFQSFGEAGLPVTAAQSLVPEEAARISAAPIIAGSVANELAGLRGSAKAMQLLPDARQWHLIADSEPIPVSALYIREADAKLPEKRA